MDIPTPADVNWSGPAIHTPHAATTGDAERHAETIRRFAFFPLHRNSYIEDAIQRKRQAWSDTLEQLANLAESEEWTGASPTEEPRPILDNYLKYTYQRLVMEQKIAATPDGEFAAFNTGLLTIHGEDIFGLFQRNQRPDVQPWFFKRWATESDRDILRYFGEEQPEMAEYVTGSGDLVFDWRRPLKLAYEHILNDNLERFPPELANLPMRARQALDHAVDLTRKRARRNYKIIVPQWYPRSAEIGAQFLMPLDLTGTGEADLALVVSAVGDAAYRGDTVLTLEMAYINARLVARPDSAWLKPQASPLAGMDEHLMDEYSE